MNDFLIYLISVIPIFLLAIVAIVLIVVILFADDFTQCPQCKKVLSGEKVSDELVGIFRKMAYTHRYRGSRMGMVLHEKHKIHYRCKYCGYEWVTFQAKEV